MSGEYSSVLLDGLLCSVIHPSNSSTLLLGTLVLARPKSSPASKASAAGFSRSPLLGRSIPGGQKTEPRRTLLDAWSDLHGGREMVWQHDTILYPEPSGSLLGLLVVGDCPSPIAPLEWCPGVPESLSSTCGVSCMPCRGDHSAQP